VKKGEQYVGDGQKGPHDWTPREPQRVEELRRRIGKAVRAADLAFWREIAKTFPEVETGDFPPDAAHTWNKAMSEAVYWWLRWNHPMPYWVDDIARKGGFFKR
jgi:hypothetical protein